MQPLLHFFLGGSLEENTLQEGSTLSLWLDQPGFDLKAFVVERKGEAQALTRGVL